MSIRGSFAVAALIGLSSVGVLFPSDGPTYRTTNRLTPGDKVIISTDLGYNRSEILGAYELRLGADSKSTAEDFNLKPSSSAAVFTVYNGSTSGTYAFKADDGRYLRNLSGRLGLVNPSSAKVYDNGAGVFASLPVTGYTNTKFTINAYGTSPWGCPIADEYIEEVFDGYNANTDDYLYMIFQKDNTALIYSTDWETTTQRNAGTWGFDGGYYWVDFSTPSEESIDTGASWTFTYDRDEQNVTISQSGAYICYNEDGNNFKVKTNLEMSSRDHQYLSVWSNANSTTATSISVNTEYENLEFEVGDTFTWTNIIVTANYGSGISNTLPIGAYEISKPDMSTSGVKTVTITYFGLTTSYQIAVGQDLPTSSSTSTPPEPTSSTPEPTTLEPSSSGGETTPTITYTTGGGETSSGGGNTSISSSATGGVPSNQGDGNNGTNRGVVIAIVIGISVVAIGGATVVIIMIKKH